MTIIDFLLVLAAAAGGFALGLMRGRQAAVEASTRLEAANDALELAQRERTEFHERAIKAEKQEALIQQALDSKQKEMADWEKHRKEMTEATKASLAETGALLSNKLLADHKRETEAAKEEGEKQVKKTTEAMFEQVKTLAEKVGGINEQQGNVQKQFHNITRMLSNPHGAGNLSEVGLENALKACNLIDGRDFRIQYTIAGGESQGLRPDCVVFLPQNSVMVIDSKSSKLLGEFADIDTSEKEKEIIQKLADSMNQHLKKLAAKNYKDAIYKEYMSAGRSGHISTIWNVMYVPNESLIEKIVSVDTTFRQKCLDEGIIIAGPAGLYSLLLMSAQLVEIAKQSENSHQILETVGNIVDSFATTLGHLGQFSKQFKTAAGTYEKVTGSINRTLLPKFSQLSSYGVNAAKHKEIPLKLPSFKVDAGDESLTIEGDTEKDNDILKLPSVVMK
jgi:DNA recombination protein RmuC